MFLSIVRLIEMLGTLVHVGRHTDRFRIIGVGREIRTC